MLMTTIIHPEAFDRSHFAAPGYRDQAEMLFRGIESNGLILVDPTGRLLDELSLRPANPGVALVPPVNSRGAC